MSLSYLYQRRIYNCCDIQGGALCELTIIKSLTIITKSSTLDVAAVLDPPLFTNNFKFIHKLIFSLLWTLKMYLAVETFPDKNTT